MSFFKRTMFYLSRKRGKTLILFLLIFTVSAFTLSCFSILYATGEVAANMRTAVGAAFHIRSSVDISMQGSSVVAGKQAVITEQDVQEIMSNGKLKYYNGRNSGYAKGLQFMPGAYHTDENNMGQMSANNYSALHPHFQEKVLELIEGRHITPSDKNVVLISETIALLNGLSVGDTVTLSPAELAQEGEIFIDALKDSKTAVEAEVIGIFKEVEPQADAAYQPTAGLRSNMIFSDHTFLEGLGLANKGDYTGGVSFFIQDPLYLEAIVDEIQQTDSINWESFFIRKDDFNYKKISTGLHTIQNLIKTLIICVSVVGAAVLILILAMRMRGRVHEAGIYLSVGIPKRQIIGQFVAEVIIIAVIAFACSYFVSGIIAGKVESGILENLKVIRIERQTLETGLIGSTAPTTLLTMPLITTAMIYASQLAALISSACLSALAIFKLKPREIFAQMS